MENINKVLKETAAPGALSVIEWALIVHENTMKLMTTVFENPEQRRLLSLLYTLDEREEARKILIEYGAGKPTRIVEHRGSKSQPIQFKTTIVPAQAALPSHDETVIDAEVVSDGGTANT